MTTSETMERFDRKDEDDRTTDGNFDRRGHEASLGTSLKRHHIDDLISGLTVGLDDVEQGRKLIVVDTYEEGCITFSKEATRRADDRELESRSHEFVGHFVLIPAMNDTDCHLHWLLHCNTVLSGIRYHLAQSRRMPFERGSKLTLCLERTLTTGFGM